MAPAIGEIRAARSAARRTNQAATATGRALSDKRLPVTLAVGTVVLVLVGQLRQHKTPSVKRIAALLVLLLAVTFGAQVAPEFTTGLATLIFVAVLVQFVSTK